MIAAVFYAKEAARASVRREGQLSLQQNAAAPARLKWTPADPKNDPPPARCLWAIHWLGGNGSPVRQRPQCCAGPRNLPAAVGSTVRQVGYRLPRTTLVQSLELSIHRNGTCLLAWSGSSAARHQTFSASGANLGPTWAVQTGGQIRMPRCRSSACWLQRAHREAGRCCLSFCPRRGQRRPKAVRGRPVAARCWPPAHKVPVCDRRICSWQILLRTH